MVKMMLLEIDPVMTIHISARILLVSGDLISARRVTFRFDIPMGPSDCDKNESSGI